ncbi:hypothetical protein I4U23_029077 [Adineta vaga]|nr:hypothetical protein I4U23_029077 [Adineta vaga]
MSASVTSNNNQDEVLTIQKQIHEKKTSILDSTRRMLGLISESEAIGTNTAVELVQQREQLENIHERCRTIDANLVDAQRNLNKLGSVFGGIKNYFQPPKSTISKSTSQPQISNGEKKKIAATQNATAAAITTRPTNVKDDTDTYFGKSRSAMDDMERETEDGLHDIHLGVNRLKFLALQMNQELEGQKPLMDNIHRDLGVLHDDVMKKNKSMKSM